MSTGRSPRQVAAGGAVATAVAPVVPLPRPGPESEPDLRVAPGPARRSALRLAGSALLVLLVLTFLGVAVFQALLVQTQSRLDEVDRAIAVEEARAERLHLEMVHLDTPERIVAEATERLGMIAPAEVLYLHHEPADDELAQLDEDAAPPAPGEG
ncbi:MAG: hypothetical protein JJU45_15950 [Acidimicrobiia bacterium]|nr:hypothetical protein [Acidimicrobiia bacterium]